MAGDALKYVKSGDALVIPSPAYNAFVDAAVDFRNRRQNGGSPGFDQFQQTGIIKVRNDSGADVDRYHLLQLDEPLFTDPDELIRNVICFSGGAVTSGSYQRVAVALEPIEADRIGRCVVTGVTIAKVQAPEWSLGVVAGQWVRPEPGETLLFADMWGEGQVLWSEGGAAEQYALVNLGPRQRRGPVVGRLTETLARGGNADLDVYDLNTDGGMADSPTGETLTIVDGDFLPDASSPLDIGVRVFGDWYGNTLMLEGFDCDLET